jgi:hypothetical protein
MSSAALLNYLGHLEVHWLKFLAVTAPGGIELNEDVFGVVDDERLERVAGNNLDGFCQVLWRVRLALDVDLRVRDFRCLKAEKRLEIKSP